MGQQDLKIHELVAKIERGEIRLPEMQRQYVWKKTRVRDLLDSLYRGYPSGTILTWDTDEAVETRDTPIAQKPGAARFQLLLDGQQRLISMSAVLRGEPVRVGGQERPINILFNLEHPDVLEFVTEVQEHNDPDSERDEETSEATDDDLLKRFNKMAFVIESRNISRLPHWVSVTDVFKSHDDSKFLTAAGIRAFDDPKYGKYTERLTRLRGIKNYEYRVHVLDNNMSYEEVTEIFVRVNSLGAKLRSSDLALAQITAKWKNSLRVFQKYEKECKDTGFDLGLGIHIRNLVAFASGQAKFKVVSSLTQSRLEKAWKSTIAGMDFALDYLRGNLGIEDSDLLTSPFLAIALAFYAHTKKYKISAVDRGKLRRWALVANAKGRYSRGSSETLLDQDLSAIREDAGTDRLLQLLENQVGRLDVEESELEGKISTSAYFKTMLIVFRKEGAVDWNSGLAASKRKLQKHHIFPKKVLKGRWVPRTINDMCNMAFISGLTNRKIGGRAPSEYLPEIIREQGEEVLQSQAIPTDRRLWEVDAYEDFLKERRKLVVARLNSYLQSK